jgi:hypothetical protein
MVGACRRVDLGEANKPLDFRPASGAPGLYRLSKSRVAEAADAIALELAGFGPKAPVIVYIRQWPLAELYLVEADARNYGRSQDDVEKILIRIIVRYRAVVRNAQNALLWHVMVGTAVDSRALLAVGTASLARSSRITVA